MAVAVALLADEGLGGSGGKVWDADSQSMPT